MSFFSSESSVSEASRSIRCHWIEQVERGELGFWSILPQASSAAGVAFTCQADILPRPASAFPKNTIIIVETLAILTPCCYCDVDY